MKRARSLNAAASEVIGSVEVLEPKIASSPMTFCARPIDFFLDLAVLEHRLDDQVAILQRHIVGRGLNTREQRVAFGGAGAAALDLIGHQLPRMLLALLGRFRIAVDEHDIEAGKRAHIGDARAHEAGAEHADFLQVFPRHGGRPAGALVDLLQRDEQRADHRRRLRRTQNFRKPARLDAQRLIHRQLQSLIDDLHDGARRRIIVVGLAPIERVCRRKHHHAGFRMDRPARQFETFDIPRRLGRAARRDPVFGRLDEIAGGHHRIDELHRLGALDIDLVAFEQELQRIGRLQHARDPLRAAGAREQSDFDLRQRQPRSVVVGGDTVMAGERQFETAADRGAIDRRDPGLAAGLDPAAKQRQFAALLEQARIRRLLALRRRQFGEGAARASPTSSDRRRRRTCPCRR